ncbi:MAG: 16S rRNA processing protein RimM [Bacteroidia bacterium]|nr:ribosome maturation factor RimM [Bacteroidia bacterium]NNC86680.1 16S rRNA processing protein RimM [Bacteroidia bacterium]NNM16902.1 16S rRNA processing protein RimM [Bacteroidia bacterium]
MNHGDFYFLGTIQRTYHMQGAVIAFFDVDDLSHYKKLDWIFIEEGGTLVPHEIEKLKLHQDSYILQLKGVSTIEKAESLVKKKLYLPLDKLPKLKGNAFYFHEVLNFTVEDVVHGELGVIEELQEFPGQTLAMIKHKGKEVLLPLNLAWIKKVDRENKRLIYSLPDGYLDVYTTEQKS